MLHALLRRRRRRSAVRHPRPVLYLAKPCEPRRLLAAIASDQTLTVSLALRAPFGRPACGARLHPQRESQHTPLQARGLTGDTRRPRCRPK